MATVNINPSIEYPDSDGLPIADNTLQFEYITLIKGGLDILFANNAEVFVAGDLLWYAVEGDPAARQGPDVLVVFGRPKGYRGSYRQWEEAGIPPHVVFEILSPGNRYGQMQRKFRFYEHHGVEEYYVFDPDDGELFGWLRHGQRLEEVPAMQGWVSPRLKVRFEVNASRLELFGPDGRRFVDVVELARQREQAEQQAMKEKQQREQAEQQREHAEQQALQAKQQREQAEQQAMKEKQQREQAEQQLADERRRAEALARQQAELVQRLQAQLKAHGIAPANGSEIPPPK